MSQLPAFNVRSYPAFGMARIYRVYVDRDALYLIRMGGLIGNADAGSRYDLHPGRALIGTFLRWWSTRWQRAKGQALDERGPRELLDAHRSNRRVEPGEVVESRLEPPRLLGHGEYYAGWSLRTRGQKPQTFQIEDIESLKTALEQLPRLLGPSLRVTVGWDASIGRIVRVDGPVRA